MRGAGWRCRRRGSWLGCLRRRAPRDAVTRTTLLVAVAFGVLSGEALAASAPDLGRPFEPTPVSQPLYDIKPPQEDPQRQRHIVEAVDGVEIWTETWLPKPKDGNVPPASMPTVLVYTPYLEPGEPYTYTSALDLFVRRGFALTTAHVRGTGGSGGCRTQLGSKEVDDEARVIEYLGRDAPWSNGRVGMYGLSHSGATQVVVAALGDPERTKYLKAIVPGAATGSWYDIRFQDGVPFLAGSTGEAVADWLQDEITVDEPGDVTPEQHAERSLCKGELFLDAADLSGDFTPFMQERESRRGVQNITAAVLLVHGSVDLTSQLVYSGLFDRLPAKTPKAGVFGIFGHDFPSVRREQVQPDWRRPDWPAMVISWFDRYLKELDSGVEGWPVSQVQGTDGQWRAEPNWPVTGGPVGQLALGPAGSLGATAPAGSTTYVEGEPLLRIPDGNSPNEIYAPGTSAVFETAPVPDRLELAGQPTLDLWVSLDKPDAHFATKLEAIAADGKPIPYGRAVGLRSAQHLEPFVDGRFVQEHGKPAPTRVPLRVPLRLRPTDLVVPKGGRLRLTVAGWVNVFRGLENTTSHPFFRGPSQLSGSATAVEILHGCAHPSALRFEMPHRDPDLLNVREIDEPAGEPLADNRPFEPPVSDGGGLATAPVCGEAPERP